MIILFPFGIVGVKECFFSDDIHIGWNGKINNSGKSSPPGVYLYLIEFTDTRGNERQEKGFATLVR